MRVQMGLPVQWAASQAAPGFRRLIYAYVVSATIWLIVGSLLGLVEALRFQFPALLDAAAVTFGRLRPMHTSTVLFGWASLALLAGSLYVVPRCCGTRYFGERGAWWALGLWNVGLLGGLVGMSLGALHGGQEYRELPTPAAACLLAALVILARNFIVTIRHRDRGTRTPDPAPPPIYISSWFIVSACLLTLVVLAIGYAPGLSRGVGQVVVQGYYMHNVIGMWFTMLAVGITYYVLPKILNKPIYSYALGMLGFWTHIVFYTVIGAHHYEYGPIPVVLESVAVIFSVAMIVPVLASSGNFLLTMRGESSAFKRSYVLPFILVGAVGYALASIQGSVQALREANVTLHFTSYTVGHSHLAMVGFVSFLAWGALYALVPRLTGREPPPRLVMIHFGLCLVGMLTMVAALSIGGIARGQAFASDRPFVEGLRGVTSAWVWRSAAGILLLAGHAFFAFNVWYMRGPRWRVPLGEGPAR